MLLTGYGVDAEHQSALRLLDCARPDARVHYLHPDPGQADALHACIHTELARDIKGDPAPRRWHRAIAFSTTARWITALLDDARALAPSAPCAPIEALAAHWTEPRAPTRVHRLHTLADAIEAMTHVALVDLVDTDGEQLGQCTPAPAGVANQALGFQMDLFGHTLHGIAANAPEVQWCGCIAAHANVLWGGAPTDTLWERARKALGLDPTRAARLFWPGAEELGTHGRTLDEITPHEAAAALRHTARGGATPWRHVAERAPQHTRR